VLGFSDCDFNATLFQCEQCSCLVSFGSGFCNTLYCPVCQRNKSGLLLNSCRKITQEGMVKFVNVFGNVNRFFTCIYSKETVLICFINTVVNCICCTCSNNVSAGNYQRCL